MKKFLSLLLCLVLALPLFSCREPAPEKEPESPTQPPATAITDYDSLLALYREIAKICENYIDRTKGTEQYATELGLTEPADKELFAALLESVYLSFPERGAYYSYSPHYKYDCGYAIKDLNGDGVDELILLNADYTVVAIFSTSNGKPVLLGSYHPRNSCWLDWDGRIHVNGNSGSMYFCHQIYKIADGGASLSLLTEYGADSLLFPFTYYYQVVNGQKTRISEEDYIALERQHNTYNGLSGKEATAEYAGLSFTRIFEESEIAMEMYAAALEGKIKVSSRNDRYLEDWETPTERLPLREAEHLGYAYLDVDGDGMNELLIDCGGTLLLRYNERKVWVYSFSDYSYFHADGSYFHNTSPQNSLYGECKIRFYGGEMVSQVVWETNGTESFIAGEPVTAEELQSYLEATPKTRLTYTPLEVAWKNKVTPTEALEIAKVYWEDYTPEETGYTIERVSNSIAPPNSYVFIIRRWVEDHYSTFDEIWIDASTGEVRHPFVSDGKGEILPEQAKQIAASYWDITDGFEEGACGTTLVHRVKVIGLYNQWYYVVWDIYSYLNEDYENGGEPYHVQTHKELFVNIYTGDCLPYSPDDWGK